MTFDLVFETRFVHHTLRFYNEIWTSLHDRSYPVRRHERNVAVKKHPDASTDVRVPVYIQKKLISQLGSQLWSLRNPSVPVKQKRLFFPT